MLSDRCLMSCVRWNVFHLGTPLRYPYINWLRVIKDCDMKSAHVSTMTIHQLNGRDQRALNGKMNKIQLSQKTPF